MMPKDSTTNSTKRGVPIAGIIGLVLTSICVLLAILSIVGVIGINPIIFIMLTIVGTSFTRASLASHRFATEESATAKNDTTATRNDIKNP